MKSCISNKAIFCKHFAEKLAGSFAINVDDKLHVGNPVYCQMSKQSEQKFRCKQNDRNKVQFAGAHTEKNR